jgi:hypothetical protein
VHLLTREAVELYFRKLAPDGLVVLHITNNHLDLEPVVSGIARSLGLTAAGRDHRPSADERRRGVNRSHWVALGRDASALGPLHGDPRWRPLGLDPDEPVWTDEYSNILSVVEWSR